MNNCAIITILKIKIVGDGDLDIPKPIVILNEIKNLFLRERSFTFFRLCKKVNALGVLERRIFGENLAFLPLNAFLSFFLCLAKERTFSPIYETDYHEIAARAKPLPYK